MQQHLQEHQQRAERIEALLQEVAQFSDQQARETTEELVQLLLDLYGEGLARLLDIARRAQSTGDALVERFAQDELLASLLLLHGLHPLDLETRVRQALDKLQTTLGPRGGTLDLLKIEQARAYLVLNGNHSSCPSSNASLTAKIEQAVHEVAPELEEILIEQNNHHKATMPVTFVPRQRQKKSTREAL